jgi:hypothetical protein
LKDWFVQFRLGVIEHFTRTALHSVVSPGLCLLASWSVSLALLAGACHAVDLSPALAKCAEEFDPEMTGNAALAPAECAKQSPENMQERLEAAGTMGGISSLAGEDQFYLAYAHQLRIQTDHDYPQIKAFRKPLLKSFQLCMEYIAELYEITPVRHEHARVPGRVEWILYQGGHSDYEYVDEDEWQPQADYEREDIERMGVIMGRAMVDRRFHKFDTEMRPLLKKCLSSFAEAERQMTSKQRRFFCRELLLFMTRYM